MGSPDNKKGCSPEARTKVDAFVTLARSYAKAANDELQALLALGSSRERQLRWRRAEHPTVSPQHWFGPFSDARLRFVAHAFAEASKRLYQGFPFDGQRKAMQIKCLGNTGTRCEDRPNLLANASEFGTIKLCPRLLEKTIQAGAMTILHESLHQLSGVDDQRSEVCRFGKETRCYGAGARALVRAGRFNKATKNNDNYVLFARAIHDARRVRGLQMKGHMSRVRSMYSSHRNATDDESMSCDCKSSRREDLLRMDCGCSTRRAISDAHESSDHYLLDHESFDDDALDDDALDDDALDDDALDDDALDDDALDADALDADALDADALDADALDDDALDDDALGDDALDDDALDDEALDDDALDDDALDDDALDDDALDDDALDDDALDDDALDSDDAFDKVDVPVPAACSGIVKWIKLRSKNTKFNPSHICDGVTLARDWARIAKNAIDAIWDNNKTTSAKVKAFQDSQPFADFMGKGKLGKAEIKDVRVRIRRIWHRLSGNQLKVVVERVSEGICGGERTSAFMRPGVDRIHLCPVYFEQGDGSDDVVDRARIIIHELSHAAGMVGHQNGVSAVNFASFTPAKDLAISDPKKARKNPSNYQWLMQELWEATK